MKKFKSAISEGFTLVELLIVIGLLGAIALIVISAINPIEQANRARDTRYKADGGQIISAIDRYFVGASAYPWMNIAAPVTASVDESFGFRTASGEEIGICGADCDTDGLLTNTNELKTEFRNRDFITGALASEQIMIGKATGSSESVYACFIPLSKSAREKACTDGKVYTLAVDDSGVRTPVTAGDPSCAADQDWGTNLLYVCIPE